MNSWATHIYQPSTYGIPCHSMQSELCLGKHWWKEGTLQQTSLRMKFHFPLILFSTFTFSGPYFWGCYCCIALPSRPVIRLSFYLLISNPMDDGSCFTLCDFSILLLQNESTLYSTLSNFVLRFLNPGFRRCLRETFGVDEIENYSPTVNKLKRKAQVAEKIKGWEFLFALSSSKRRIRLWDFAI